MFKKNPFKKAAPAQSSNNANSPIANKPGAQPQRATAGAKKKPLPPNYLDPKLF